jgi:hypothetical protein
MSSPASATVIGRIICIVRNSYMLCRFLLVALLLTLPAACQLLRAEQRSAEVRLTPIFAPAVHPRVEQSELLLSAPIPWSGGFASFWGYSQPEGLTSIYLTPFNSERVWPAGRPFISNDAWSRTIHGKKTVLQVRSFEVCMSNRCSTAFDALLINRQTLRIRDLLNPTPGKPTVSRFRDGYIVRSGVIENGVETRRGFFIIGEDGTVQQAPAHLDLDGAIYWHDSPSGTVVLVQTEKGVERKNVSESGAVIESEAFPGEITELLDLGDQLHLAVVKGPESARLLWVVDEQLRPLRKVVVPLGEFLGVTEGPTGPLVSSVIRSGNRSELHLSVATADSLTPPLLVHVEEGDITWAPISWNGREYAITWVSREASPTRPAGVLALVSPTLTAVAGQAPQLLSVTVSYQSLLATGTSRDQTLVVWREVRHGASQVRIGRISARGEPLDGEGVILLDGVATIAAVGSSSTHYLVVAARRIFLVDRNLHEVREVTSTLGVRDSVAVASDGTSFLLYWTDGNPAVGIPEQIQTAIVHADGTLGDSGPMLPDNRALKQAHVVWDGSRYVAVLIQQYSEWQDFLVVLSLDRDGKPDAARVIATENMYRFEAPRILPAGDGYAVAFRASRSGGSPDDGLRYLWLSPRLERISGEEKGLGTSVDTTGNFQLSLRGEDAVLYRFPATLAFNRMGADLLVIPKWFETSSQPAWRTLVPPIGQSMTAIDHSAGSFLLYTRPLHDLTAEPAGAGSHIMLRHLAYRKRGAR